MTPEQLAAIAARNAARTPGKWTQHLVDDTTVVCRGQDICCTFPGGGLDDDVDFNTDTEQRELDAAFIAHASEDIPALLAEVARLTAALTEAEKRHVDLHRLAYSWMVAHDKLKAGKPYAFPSPLEPDAITKLETTAYQHGYDAAKEQAMQAVEDAGWYRSSDDAVSWDAQDEQVQYSIAAIAAMVKP